MTAPDTLRSRGRTDRVLRTLLQLGLVLAAAGGMLGPARTEAQAVSPAAGKPNEIHLISGRSLVLENPTDIVRISVANPEVVDAVAVTTREVVLNGKAAGTTTLILWSKPGEREMFTVTVDPNTEAVQRQISESFAGERIQIHAGREAVTLTGQVSSAAVAQEAAALAAGVAKTVVNRLEVLPPPVDKQVLLRVRFAEVDRAALNEFGLNLISTGALNTPGSISTQQFGPPRAENVNGSIGSAVSGTTSTFTLNDVLNIFAFRPDLNLAALLKALQSRNLLQILAEPNLITSNGHEATFLAGGEFPFPVIQGGANAGAVTIQFREFGVRLTFLPQLTRRDTIRLHVRPEVSSLDFSNGLVISGFTIPALSTRRVDADVELALGQSFAIAGLLDRRVTENLARIPGLSSVPLLGNLFKSRSTKKSDSELMVVVTPEVAGPGTQILKATAEPPPIVMDQPFLQRPGPAGAPAGSSPGGAAGAGPGGPAGGAPGGTAGTRDGPASAQLGGKAVPASGERADSAAGGPGGPRTDEAVNGPARAASGAAGAATEAAGVASRAEVNPGREPARKP